jgi:hypothetical protein
MVRPHGEGAAGSLCRNIDQREPFLPHRIRQAIVQRDHLKRCGTAFRRNALDALFGLSKVARSHWRFGWKSTGHCEDIATSRCRWQTPVSFAWRRSMRTIVS